MGKEPTVTVTTQEGEVLDFTLTACEGCGSDCAACQLHDGLCGSCQLRLRTYERVQCRTCGVEFTAHPEADPQCPECRVQARRDRAATAV